MSLVRSLVASATALVFAAALVPAFAFAQSYNCNPNNSWNFWGNNNTSVCASGNLLVYVQVNNNVNNGFNRVPADFSVVVSGINPSPATFPGSISGTQVNVAGNYSVVALQLQGYTASYSTGCTGTIGGGDRALCIITENSQNSYNQYPTSYYPYTYHNAPLICTPANQTVNLGAPVTFSAQGGDFSQYNWQTPTRAYLNAGPTLNVVMLSTGTQTVTVSNGATTATCAVTVVPGGAPAAVVNPYLNPLYSSTYGNVYVTPTYVPRLPNTGFEPVSAAAAATAVALLIAAALIALPYIKQAFKAVLN